MDKMKLEYFKDKLITEQQNHKNLAKLMAENGDGEQDRFSSGELSNYDNHPADLGTEVFQITLNNSLKVNEEYNINQIEEALQKIAEGNYGICDICKSEISNERLEILPSARKCINCENEFGVRLDDPQLSRPIEEKIIDAPFGRKYLNKREDDEDEGLDILNDLMEYGSSDSPQDLGGYHEYEEYYTNEIDKQGIVEGIDNISNEDYKKQLP